MSHCYYYRATYQLSFIGITYFLLCLYALWLLLLLFSLFHIQTIFPLRLFGFLFLPLCAYLMFRGGCHPGYSQYSLACTERQPNRIERQNKNCANKVWKGKYVLAMFQYLYGRCVLNETVYLGTVPIEINMKQHTMCCAISHQSQCIWSVVVVELRIVMWNCARNAYAYILNANIAGPVLLIIFRAQFVFYAIDSEHCRLNDFKTIKYSSSTGNSKTRKR